MYQRLKPGVILTYATGKDTDRSEPRPSRSSSVSTPCRTSGALVLRRHASGEHYAGSLGPLHVLTGAEGTRLKSASPGTFPAHRSGCSSMPTQRSGQTQRFAPCTGLALLPNLAARLHENALPITRSVTNGIGYGPDCSGFEPKLPLCPWQCRLSRFAGSIRET